MDCSNCGSALPDDARFCPQCGIRLRGPDTSPPFEGADAGPARDPIPPTAWDVCEIRWWQGYLKADFYAHLLSSKTDGTDIARSPTFWWRRDEPPSAADAALVAHEALVDALVESGWEPTGVARPWFAQRFRRRRVLGGPDFVETPPPGPPTGG